MDRIDAICTLIEPCKTLIDVGCDHGLVSLYALKIGVEKVIASDISEGSLNKARTLIGDDERAKFTLSDGFKNISEKVDCAVISGMGGLKIMEILSGIDYKPTLILGAQHNVYELRKYLIESGYEIEKDFCFFDRGKYYDFIRAKAGKSKPLSEVQLRYGVFYKQKSEHLHRFITEKLAKLKGYKQTEQNLKLTKQAEEVLKWQE